MVDWLGTGRLYCTVPLLSIKSPGHAAKLAEDRKFDVDKAAATPVSSVFGGDHVLVPFAMEDGGVLVLMLYLVSLS